MFAKGIGQVNRNFWLGVYNGIFINGAEAFFHSTLVFAPFLAALGTPAPLIGLVPALRIGGWLLPQLFVATRLAYEPFKLPWYRRVNFVRSLAYVLMVIAVFRIADPRLLTFSVLAMICVSAIAGGLGGLSFADVTAKVVPHYRLGTFWVLRNTIGGVLALMAGYILRQVLAGDIPFPHNFGYIFLFGTVLSIVSFSLFGSIREPEGEVMVKEPFIRALARAPQLLHHNAVFRRYLMVRFLGMLSLVAEPFYAVYCLQHLNAPVSVLGFLVMFSTAASIISNVALRQFANRGENVFVYQLSLSLLLLAPTLALMAHHWMFFILVFMASAAGQAGVGIATWNLLYAVSEDSQRTIYVGTANTILTLPSLAPIVAGFFIESLGFNIAFILAAIFALIAFMGLINFSSLKERDQAALKQASS
ncbi:MAG: MFS transporter [Deinococcales bacterium]